MKTQPWRDSSRQQQSDRNFQDTRRYLLSWITVSNLLLLICALKAWMEDRTWNGATEAFSLFCHGGLLGLAFVALGGLVGFLFGIPQANSKPAQGKSKENQGTDGKGLESPTDSGPSGSTNLEQVSDWLTKIILGAGLTQLTKIPIELKALGLYMQNDLGGSQVLPILIVLNSLILGFFTGYLMTRLFLLGAFAVADQNQLARALRIAENQATDSRYGAAAATLETAINEIGPNTPRETKLLYYERLTYTALYEPPPTGFQKVILYANRYLAEEPQGASARIYVNLACAYGQQFDWERTHGNSPDVLKSARDNALKCVREALRLDPGTKTVLQMVWNPNISKMSEEENDLEIFYEDPEFKELLGK